MRKILLIALCCVVLSAPRAAEVAIGRHTIDLPLPSGYCAVTDQSKPERLILEIVSRMQPPQLMMLLLAAECADLKALREGKRPRLERYVMYLKERQTVSNRPTLTRAAYVQQIASEIPKLDARELESEVKRLTTRAGMNVNVQQAALLEQADDAVYSGLLFGAGTMRIAAVSATTLVHGEGLSVSFYRTQSGTDAYNAMLRDAKKLVRAILAAEQAPQTEAAAPAPSRWSLAAYDSSVVAAGAGVVIAALVLLVGALLLRGD